MMVSRGGAVGRRGWGGLVASVGWWAPVGVWELYCDAFGIICGNSRGWMLVPRIRFMIREIKIFFFFFENQRSNNYNHSYIEYLFAGLDWSLRNHSGINGTSSLAEHIDVPQYLQLLVLYTEKIRTHCG